MMTVAKSDLPHALYQLSMRSFVTPVTFVNLSTSTCYECYRVIMTSMPRATCTTCGQSRHLTCNRLSRRERESIRDGCREWRCCGTAQSTSTSTTSCGHFYTTSRIPESTMLWEESVVHMRTQQDGVPPEKSRTIYSSIKNQTRQVPCS